jgi:uncharacterized repeat protein (TIGR01451 family)
VDMGAYEVQVAPYLGLSKVVTPETSATFQGTIIYTVVLDNFGALSDTHVLLTDTLSSNASFGDWIEQPSGAVVEDDVMTWSGTVEGGASITFAYGVHYTSDGYGDTLTNTAEFSGTFQTGQAQAAFAVEPPVLYIDGDASGAATGLSWTDAYTTLQDALDRTNAHGSHAYQIWVAQGIYYPDEDGDGDHVSDAVTETFRINYNNVQLYGGFAGGETAHEQRDGEANVTVLSGDIDGNDTTDTHGVVMEAGEISGTNANHVVWLDGETNESITGASTIDGFTITGASTIDGFTITAGQADGSSRDDAGGGMFCAGSGWGNAGNEAECSLTLANIIFSGNWADSGGAIFNDGTSGCSSPTLTNVTFTGNSADWHGGAMASDGRYGNSNPTLTNVTFSGNWAHWDGGAMYNDGYFGTSSPALADVTFSGNSAGSRGGGMFNYGFFDGASSPTLTNVTFGSNSAYEGGAMYNHGKYGDSSPTLTNVTFSGNSAYKGGAMYSDGGNEGASSPTLTNVILWGNNAAGDGDHMANVDATPAIGYSLVEGGWDGSGIYNKDSTVTDNGGNINADPQFIDAEAGDLHLSFSSPAIDAGDNSAVPSGVTTDLDGNPRFVDIPTVADTGSGTPPVVDMGAYEVQNPQSRAYLPAVLRNQP